MPSVNVNSSQLSEYLSLRLDEGMYQKDSKKHTIAKALFIVTTLGISFLSNPLIAPPTLITHKPFSYANFLAYGNSVSSAFICSWAITKIFDHFFEPMGKAEWKNTANKLPEKCFKIITAVALGVLLRIPVMELYKKSNPHNQLAPITMLAVDSWFPIYSTLIGVDFLVKGIKHLCKNPIEKKIIKARNRQISILKRNLKELPQITSKQRNDRANKLIPIKNSTDSADKKQSYLEFATKDPRVENFPFYSPILKFIGGAFSLGAIFGLGYINYVGLRSMNAKPTVAIAGGVLTGFFYSFGILSTVPKAFSNLEGTLLNVALENRLVYKLAPRASFIGNLLAAGIFPFAYGAAVDAGTYYFNGTFQKILQVTMGGALVSLTAMSVLHIVNTVLERLVIKKIGTKEEKELMLYDKKLRLFIDVLKNAPLHRTVEFLKELPDAVKRLTDFDTLENLENLNTYLRSYEEQTQLI